MAKQYKELLGGGGEVYINYDKSKYSKGVLKAEKERIIMAEQDGTTNTLNKRTLGTKIEYITGQRICFLHLNGVSNTIKLTSIYIETQPHIQDITFEIMPQV